MPSSSPVTQPGPSSSSPAPQQPVQATVETPTALPAGGAVTSGTQVTLTSTTASAEVYYTTDLSEPTTSSTRYTGPITITSNTTIKAVAIKTGSKNSPVARFEYTVNMPILLPDSIQPMTEGEFYTGSVAKLSGGTGAVTYAVTDGALPEGLTLNPITGEITGIPSVSGGYDFTISATDSATPPATETNQYTGTISPALSSKTPLDLINEAAESGDWTAVDESIFAAAGITGVTSEYLSGIQGILQDYDYPSRALPKDQSQIQTIVNETINLTLINYYFAYGYGTEPTKETFELAGLTGVTDANLADIIAHLQSKYRGAGGEPGGDPGGFPGGFPSDDSGEIPGDGSGGFPGGFPGDGSGGSLYSGSSKQEVQAVIDEYLAIWGQMNLLE